MAGGSQKKTCPNCGEKIYCGLKICSFCKHPQPQHVRLQKKLEKFKSQQKQWLASMKKNKIKSHILDDAAILLEKLYALGMKPLLLIAHPPKMVTGTHTYQTKIMLPMHAQLSTSAKTCLENVNAIYKLMVEGWTRLNPDQLPQEDEENFILNLVPCGSPIQEPAHQAPPIQEPAHLALSSHTPPHTAPPIQKPAHQAPPIQEPAHQAPPIQEPAHLALSSHTPPHTAPPIQEPAHQAPPIQEPAHLALSSHTPPHTAPPIQEPAHQAPPIQEPAHLALSSHTPPHTAPPIQKPAHQAPPIQEPAHQAPLIQEPAHLALSSHTPPHTAPPIQKPAHQAPPIQEPAHQAPLIQEPAHQVSAVQPPLRGPQQRKRLQKIKDCPHNRLEMFPVRETIKTRKRKGRTEHLYDWQPCTMCGKTWPPSWQPA